MASVSSATSGLGNTSLRGYSGLASGIDRDAIIEQMTLGTTTKIANKRKEITSAEWKQDAYREVIDQILNMEDKYYTYSSTESLLNRDFFSRSQVTAVGDPSVTKYISAAGNSDMLEYLSILGVKQMATAAYVKSTEKNAASSIATGITSDRLMDPHACKSSKLEGMVLQFGNYKTDGTWNSQGSFTFASTYKVTENGKEVTKTIDYTNPDTLADQLNEALQNSSDKIAGKKISELMEFKMEGGGLKLHYKNSDNEDVKKIQDELRIRDISATTALGIKAGKDAEGNDEDFSKGLTLDQFNSHSKDFAATTIEEKSLAEYMSGKKLTVTFGGQTKEIALVTEDELKRLKRFQSGVSDDEIAAAEAKLKEAEEAKKAADETDDKNAITEAAKKLEEAKKELTELKNIKQDVEDQKAKGHSEFDYVQENIQNRLDKAFGSGKVTVDKSADGTSLEFKLASGSTDSKATTLIVTNSSESVRKELGIAAGASNKITLGASLYENREMLGFDKDMSEDEFDQALKEMKINGVSGEELGVNKDTTVNDFINAINKNEDIGVRASFLSASNQFALIATETGTGRTIDVQGAAAVMFDGTEDDELAADGKDAEMTVSYGNGLETTTVTSSTNTFDLEGLKVTVSGTFGDYDAAGEIQNRTKAVTFNAKADVDAATERVKKFIEAYNELASKIDKEITTKPDSDYGPLTDEQKDEMDDTSIENWEKKAKEGLLFGDPYLRQLSTDLQSMYVSLVNDGINPKDLESIGISLSSDWRSGGQLEFDEAKFRQAMTEDPDKVADIMCGGGDVKTGLAATIGNKLSTYATRLSYKHNGSNGSLVEIAGCDRITSSLTKNQIYDQLKQMQEDLENLKSLLTTEQDRYIRQFTTMETLISQMNSQSSYLSGLNAG